jgi:hypothetical protein
VRGTAPNEKVTTGSSNVTGGLTQTGISLGFNDSAQQFGTLSPGSLQIEVPQTDGTLVNITFTVASVSSYNSALANLRSAVNEVNDAATTATSEVSVPSSAEPSAPQGSPTIAVAQCPTTYGAGRPPASPDFPAIPVNLPESTASQLSFYTTDTNSTPPVLGPASWACTALVGADGSTNLTIYPSGGTVPRSGTVGQPSVIAQSDSACQSCVYGTVCRVVPSAATQLGYSGSGLACAPTPLGESTYWIRGSANAVYPINDVVGFEDPGTPSPTDGVVLYNKVGPNQNGSASEDDCTLPASQHSLCTAILNDFSAQAWLMS